MRGVSMLKCTGHAFNNRYIHVIDGLFSRAEIEGIYVNLCALPFRVANSNQIDVQNMQDRHLKADVDENFLGHIGFFGGERKEKINGFFSDADYKIYKSYVNLGLKGDDHRCHVDAYYPGQGKTLIYYANREWDANHGGETVFYDMDQKEIIFVSTYTPGRVIIFDSDMPHSARPQSFDAPNYRFTLALKFIKNGPQGSN